MTKTKRKTILKPAVVCFAALWCAAMLPSSNALAGQARALTWNNPSVCGTGYQDLYADDVAYWWLYIMGQHYSTTTLFTTVRAPMVTDYPTCTWGQDHQYGYLDDGDATILIGHGGPHGSTQWKYILSDAQGNGDVDGGCHARSIHMKIGDNDAEFTHILSCDSGTWDIVHDGQGYHALADEIHGFGGFHGAHAGYWAEWIVDFAEDAWDAPGSVSTAWITHFSHINYYPNALPGRRDLCAVAITHGDDDTDAHNRRLYEDYTTTGYENEPDGDGHWYTYICGCDPPGGPGPLPSC